MVQRQRTDLHGGYVEHGSYAAPPREYTEPYYSGHSAPPPPAMDYSYPARAPVDSYRDPVPAPYHRSDVHPPRSLLPPPPARSGALLPLPAPARPVVPAYDRSHVGSGGGAGPGDAGDPAMYPRTRVVGRRRARSRSPSPGRTGQPPDVARRGSSGASTAFVMDKLKGAADAIVKQLYNDGPRCTNCGLRFEKANEVGGSDCVGSTAALMLRHRHSCKTTCRGISSRTTRRPRTPSPSGGGMGMRTSGWQVIREVAQRASRSFLKKQVRLLSAHSGSFVARSLWLHTLWRVGCRCC